MLKELIYKSYKNSNWKRPHLGASLIGRECRRAIWYSFRWAIEPEFDGRILRLFSRGHEEEIKIIKELRKSGVVVYCNNSEGEQFSYSEFGGLFAGSLDAVGQYDGKTFLIEFKTSNAKGFKKLEKEGVYAVKPEHFIQMQIYMHWAKLSSAYYIAVCKDDDHIHEEEVLYDEGIAMETIGKAKSIIFDYAPPSKMWESPTYFKCKYCDYYNICHFSEQVPDVNCRTCKHISVNENNKWFCSNYKKEMSFAEQKTGCTKHKFIPDFMVEEVEGLDNSELKIIKENNIPQEDAAKLKWPFENAKIVGVEK